MPKKKKKKKNLESQAEQSARFQAEVERLVAAGELSHTEADAALDHLVRQGFVDDGGKKN
ncbi:hypothetical protein [Novosphingobium sp.]|uniref:hypothetical protein n=1 Tax=Novosphingobium sp. TaxID=1874826 RepID=UPI00260A5A68|nr:hypothetical protein [Novosphingobium sp.]